MKKEKTKKKKQLPEKKFLAGGVEATIWKKKLKKDDRSFTVRNVTFVRNYMTEDEDWEKTNSYNMNDLIKLQTVLNKTIEYMFLNNGKDKKEDSDDEDDGDEEQDELIEEE